MKKEQYKYKMLIVNLRLCMNKTIFILTVFLLGVNGIY
ncbi:MAG: hypothetical protein ACI8RP_001177, partial [Urechidicola sp.]